MDADATDAVDDDVDTDPSVKLHRREVWLDGRSCTLLTLRPSTTLRFATNHFHGTWHVITDAPGARLIGRMCWSMSYQRNPGTLMLIDYPLLVTNPFDADPSSPVLIVNQRLGGPTREALRQLHRLLPLRSASQGTVKLHTASLDRVLAGERNLDNESRKSGIEWNDHQQRAVTDRISGIVVLSAFPTVLRSWSHSMSSQDRWNSGSYESPLNRGDRNGLDAEVQVFQDFAEMRQRALTARAQLFPDAGDRELLIEERQQVWEATRSTRPL